MTRNPWSVPEEPTEDQKKLACVFPRIVLASASPARKAELVNAGIDVAVIPTDADETVPQTAPAEKVTAIARRKLSAYLARDGVQFPALTCDTMISFQGRMIGKPSDREDAFKQLMSFSGVVHEVYTGWALAYPTGTIRLNHAGHNSRTFQREVSSDGSIETIWGYDRASVVFRTLSDAQINDYLETGEWQGAAGSYRIQGAGAGLVESIEGDYATVVGLPISMISGIVVDTAVL